MSATGACQCGAVRYRVARLGGAYACHCRECRRQSASAFAISVPVWFDELTVTGDLACYRRATDSGTHTDCFFCPACGVRLYHRSLRHPAVATLKGGTLDTMPAVTAHIWMSRAPTWLSLPPGKTHPAQPDDLAAWRARFLPPRQPA